MIGQVFGQLTVLRVAGRARHGRHYVVECQCTCGNVVDARADNLRSGRRRSCGCLRVPPVPTRALGVEQRDRIVAEVERGPIGLGDLARAVGMRPNTVTQHCARLVESGVLYRGRAVTRDGLRVIYATSQAAADETIACLVTAARMVRPVVRARVAKVEIPAAPPSEERAAGRMLPIYAERRGDTSLRLANATARAWGVERRHTCERYDACLAEIARLNADDALCPRNCFGYVIDPAETREARLYAAMVERAAGYRYPAPISDSGADHG